MLAQSIFEEIVARLTNEKEYSLLSARQIQIIKFEPSANQTFFFWHVYVRGLRSGAHYACRIDGP
jgi:hypothetical protein